MKLLQIQDVINIISNDKPQLQANKEFKIKCMLHKEKTASFSYNTSKNTFICFGCNKQGNTEQLIKEYYKLNDIKEVYNKAIELGIYNNDNYKPNQILDNHKDIKTEYQDITTFLANCSPLKEPTEYLINRCITSIKNNLLYITNKDFTLNGISYTSNSIIIPIYSDARQLEVVGLQIIDTNNNKQFLKGCKASGCITLRVNNLDDNIYMVEGLIDGLSLNAVGKNALVVFSLSNMKKIALNNYDDLKNRCYVFCDLVKNEAGQELEIAKEVALILNTNYYQSHRDDCKDCNDLLKISDKELLKAFTPAVEYITNSIRYMLKHKVLNVYKMVSENTKHNILYNFKNSKHNSTDYTNAVKIIAKHLQEQGIIRYVNKDNINIVSSVLDNHLQLANNITYNPSKEYLEVIREGNNKLLNIYKPDGISSLELPNKQGNWDTLRALLMNICNNDLESFNWLIQFLAFKQQKPTSRNKNILVFTGCQGSGKSLFAILLNTLYGSNVNKDLSTQDLERQFTTTYCNKLYCVIEEATQSSKAVLSNLKSLSGKDTLKLEAKGQNPIANYPNYATFILLSNAIGSDIVNIDSDDSRYSFFNSTSILDSNIASKLYNDKELFLKEVKAFFIYLNNFVIDVEYIQPLDNNLKQEVKEHSKSNIAIFLDKISNPTTLKEYLDIYNNKVSDILPIDIDTSRNRRFIDIRESELWIDNNTLWDLVKYNCDIKENINVRTNRFTSQARECKAFDYKTHFIKTIMVNNLKASIRYSTLKIGV